MRLADPILRVLLTGVHYVLRASWFVTRPRTFGAHAMALTPEGKAVLVKLRYAPGWRLPGGGRKESEPAVDAALRELREEIGMISHGEAKPACDYDEPVYFKRDSASLIVVSEVRYKPRWSWEVEAVCEAHLDDLPSDLSPASRSMIERLRPIL